MHAWYVLTPTGTHGVAAVQKCSFTVHDGQRRDDDVLVDRDEQTPREKTILLHPAKAYSGINMSPNAARTSSRVILYVIFAKSRVGGV